MIRANSCRVSRCRAHRSFLHSGRHFLIWTPHSHAYEFSLHSDRYSSSVLNSAQSVAVQCSQCLAITISAGFTQVSHHAHSTSLLLHETASRRAPQESSLLFLFTLETSLLNHFFLCLRLFLCDVSTIQEDKTRQQLHGKQLQKSAYRFWRYNSSQRDRQRLDCQSAVRWPRVVLEKTHKKTRSIFIPNTMKNTLKIVPTFFVESQFFFV